MNRRIFLVLLAGVLLAVTLIAALGARRRASAPAAAPLPRAPSPAIAAAELDEPGLERPARARERARPEGPQAPRSEVGAEPRPERPVEQRLEGIVVDDAGNPLADVTVFADGRGLGGQDLETRSNDEGRFVLERWRGGLLRATREGYLLAAPVLVEREAVGTDGVTIVMSATGRLTVRAESDAGHPVPGVRVLVSFAQPRLAQHSRPEVHPLLSTFLGQREGLTDDAGRAAFENLWTGCYLTLTLEWNDLQYRVERCDGENLVLAGGTEDEDLAAPIEIAAGDARLLVARLPPMGLVRGQVRASNGAPVPEPWIHLRRGYDTRWDGLSWRTRGTESGTFELRLPIPGPEEEREFFTLVAQDSQGIDRGLVDGEARAMRAGTAFVDSEDLAQGTVEVTIVVERLLAISGQVREADGSRPPRLTRVQAVPEEGPRSAFREHPRLGLPYWASCQPDGHFEVVGLEAGKYELVVEEPIGSSGLRFAGTFTGATHHFPVVSAGTSGLRLTLPEEPRTQVIVEALGPPAVDRAWIFIQRSWSRRRWRRAGPTSRKTKVTSLVRWPAFVPALGFEGLRAGREAGRMMHETLGYGFEGSGPYKLPPLGEGVYTFGLTAVGPEGRAFPMATRVSVRPGDLRLSFELQPTGALSGRITTRPEDPPLYIALSDAKGKRIPLFRQDLSGEFAQPERRLDRQGAFSLPLVPAGHFQLLVGTKEGLASEDYLHVESIECAPGETTKVEVSL